MKIICPQCAFSREVASDQLPAQTVIVTCPKCACRFRFSPAEGVREVLPAPSGSARPTVSYDAGGNETPPPGAIVPGGEEHQSRAASDAAADLASAAPSPASSVPAGTEAQPRGAGRGAAQQTPEDEETRRAASQAYARETARIQAEGGEAEPNPWESAPGQDGWFAAFYQTILRVFFTAPRFFSGLNPAATQMRPLYFALLISLIQVPVEYFWLDMMRSTLAANANGDQQLNNLVALLEPQMNLLMTMLMRTATSILMLYIFSWLIHTVLKFTVPDRANFSLIFQVAAYSEAPALLCIVPLLGSLAGAIWSIACLIVGLRAALRLSWAQTLMGLAPAAFALMLFMQLYTVSPA